MILTDDSVQSSKVIEDSSRKATSAVYDADSYIKHAIRYSDDPRLWKEGEEYAIKARTKSHASKFRDLPSISSHSASNGTLKRRMILTSLSTRSGYVWFSLSSGIVETFVNDKQEWKRKASTLDDPTTKISISESEQLETFDLCLDRVKQELFLHSQKV